jgi:hypothetical protein
MKMRKVANAFYPDAMPSRLVPADALSVIHFFRRRLGGLWVGGTVEVSQSGVSFSPNLLNRAVHETLEPIRIAAEDIRKVRCKFGWVTGIVVVEHEGGEFRFRCYGARRLAADVSAALGAIRAS